MPRSAQPQLDADPRPEFLEMVGRLAGAYCPQLLPTDVVEIARSALAGRAADQINAVENAARAALDAAIAPPEGYAVHEGLQP